MSENRTTDVTDAVHSAGTLRAFISGLSGWQRAATAFLAGALGTACLAPTFLWPLLPVSLLVLLWLVQGSGNGRRAFMAGWWYGFGYLWAGLYWVSFSMLVDAARFAWAIPLASLVLPMGLAIYFGIAAAAARLLARPGTGGVLALAFSIAATEWVRGQAFSGFPWNLAGYSVGASLPVLQSASVVGVYALTLLVTLAALSPASLFQTGRSLTARLGPPVLAILLVGGAWVWGWNRLQEAGPGNVPEVALRIVQPNIPQQEKWDPALRARNLERALALSVADQPDTLTHIIWPEAAVPYLLAEDRSARLRIADVAPDGGGVIAGTARRTGASAADLEIWNSVLAITSEGEVSGIYDKQHLVPFGEYLPLRTLLAPLGIDKLVFGETDYSAGSGSVIMNAVGLPAFRALVCYEGVFPDELNLNGEAEFLLNVTNDAWFGETSGPWQHMEMERMRAVEQGLPLVRAANTGVSMVADARGRILNSLSLGVSGVIDTELPARLERPTLYSRTGETPFLIAVLVGLLWLLGRRLAARRDTP